MKKLRVSLLAAVMALGFVSCSVDDTGIDIPQDSLLKAKVNRDASGAYSVDYVVADKIVPSIHKGLESSSNEIHLNKVGFDTKTNYNDEFTLDKNKLEIGFRDNVTGKSTQFFIEDENITFAKGDKSRFLESYNITTNDDGTFQLDFEVKTNVATSFAYNNDLDAYEVHLSRGLSSEQKFSRTLEVPETGILKVDFVNHTLRGKSTSLGELVERIPRVIIVVDE